MKIFEGLGHNLFWEDPEGCAPGDECFSYCCAAGRTYVTVVFFAY